MRTVARSLALALSFLTGACLEQDQGAESPRVVGDSPHDVASSITRLKAGLDPDKGARFAQAITTLGLVTPDKADERSVGNVTPHFASMVSGRNVDQIIQIADVYRASVPMDRR